jgi:hypothetical protein
MLRRCEFIRTRRYIARDGRMNSALRYANGEGSLHATVTCTFTAYLAMTPNLAQ